MNISLCHAVRVMGAGIAAAFFATAPMLASPAHAEERHDRREHGRERFQTPHWVFDDRFHHNHYYPTVGYSLSVLPAGNLAVTFRDGRFFFQAGVWYQRSGPGYMVVRPPIGIVVPVLPPAYTTVWSVGVPYYYANDVYYVERPGSGYVVAAPPMEASSVPAPIAPAPAAPIAPSVAPQAVPAAPASWYYCESAKAYYPYVAECREGWRTVPAAPPQGR